MKKMSAAGKTVTLKVRYEDFETVTRSYTLPNYTDRAEDLANVSKRLLKETEAGIREIRLVGISVSSLNLAEGGTFGEQLEIPFDRSKNIGI